MKSRDVSERCPDCGVTLEDFRKTGLFGCATCYRIFRAEVIAAVRKVQGRTRHIGNSPAPEAGIKYDLLLERQALLESLSRALSEGRPEEARGMERRLEEIGRALEELG